MTSAVPAAPDLRAALRRVRREHSDRGVGELLTDVYLFAFLGVLYGGGAAVSIHRHLSRPSAAAADASLRAWLVLGLAITGTALLWRGLRALGPLVTTPAVQSWVLATPVDRAGWLRFPFAWLLVLSAVGGAVTGVLAGWAGLGGTTGSVGGLLAGIIGGAVAMMLAGAAVIAQPLPFRVGRRTSAVVLLVGLALIAGVIAAQRAGVVPVRPVLPAVLVSVAAATAALLAARQGRRALVRLDRAALSAGTQIAGAAVTATVMLDPSLLSGVLSTRRWRLAATVHSRRLRRGPRWWVLLQADLIRQGRRRADVLAYAVLALAPYAASLFAQLAVGPVRVVAAYLAVDRLAGGLRTVARTPALRRMLGGSDRELRLTHLVVPGLGLMAWWWATGWAIAAPAPLSLLLALGVLAAVYRTATRPPMSYDTDISDSPLGPIPTSFLRRVVRGPDLVAILVLVDLFVSAGGRAGAP